MLRWDRQEAADGLRLTAHSCTSSAGSDSRDTSSRRSPRSGRRRLRWSVTAGSVHPRPLLYPDQSPLHDTLAIALVLGLLLAGGLGCASLDLGLGIGLMLERFGFGTGSPSVNAGGMSFARWLLCPVGVVGAAAQRELYTLCSTMPQLESADASAP